MKPEMTVSARTIAASSGQFIAVGDDKSSNRRRWAASGCKSTLRSCATFQPWCSATAQLATLSKTKAAQQSAQASYACAVCANILLQPQPEPQGPADKCNAATPTVGARSKQCSGCPHGQSIRNGSQSNDRLASAWVLTCSRPACQCKTCSIAAAAAAHSEVDKHAVLVYSTPYSHRLCHVSATSTSGANGLTAEGILRVTTDTTREETCTNVTRLCPTPAPQAHVPSCDKNCPMLAHGPGAF